MIYLDNGATALQKPPAVATAMAEAVQTLGNPGRSFYHAAMEAARTVYRARAQIARLAGMDNPLNVAFTSNATESLNLVINSLITPADGVITTVLEHNSVLRPLYRLGCPLSFLDCDEEGRLCLEELPGLLTPNTRFMVCCHGSNLLGTLADVAQIQAFCKEHGLTLILDVSQTMGCREVLAEMADVLCFTGHKALMGPQGTGGIIVAGKPPFRLVKTGGSGSDSFAAHQPLEMPDIFEAGTHNTPGLAGLGASLAFVEQVGVAAVQKQEQALTDRFLSGVEQIDGVTVYGPRGTQDRLPVVALNVGDSDAGEVALRLWEGWEIATRAGSHCAPLAHQRFGTEKRGMVRFSFGYYNTPEEIDTALEALAVLAKEMRTSGGNRTDI